jgi:hypothetical protein
MIILYLLHILNSKSYKIHNIFTNFILRWRFYKEGDLINGS